MRIGSLFSGYGGLDLAVEAVLPDARPVWHVEFDEAPSRILAHHYPQVPNLHDVTTVDWKTVEPVDIITAGYPCQPFSLNGLRKGTTDDRHLWPHVLNAIRVLRPRFAFFENVRGHLTLGFDTVLADLASIGWDAEWVAVRASDVGAPHVRERLFILAYPHGQRLEAERSPGGAATRQPIPADSLASFPRPGDPADFLRECELRWGTAGPRIANWALVHGYPPPPVVEKITYHDEELWGRRFPEAKPTLNPEFAEWCMGLPAGWVTDPAIGLTRAQQLKAVGNGVCPQQGAAALRELLFRAKEA